MMDWQKKKLGELCNIELGKTPYRKDKSFWDTEKQTENVWLSIADLLNADGAVVSDSKEYISDKAADISKIVKKGTLLVSFKLTLGRLAFAGRDLFTNEAIAALTIKNEEEIDKYFLYKYLSFFDWDKAAEGDVKVKGKTLNKSKLKEIEVQFPKSLTEQQRIVSILDKAFAAIDKAKANAERCLSLSKDLFESYLQGVFENGRENWEVKTLDEVCEFRNGAAHEKHVDEKGKYILINSKYISSDGEKYKRTNDALAPLFVNDIAFVMSDVPNGKALAKCFLVNQNDTYTLNQRIGAIKSKEFVPEFLVYQFNRNKYLLSFNNGENQTNLRKGDILKCPLWMPPKEEQQTIIHQLDPLRAETQKLEAVYQKKMDDLEELKKSILQLALSPVEGEVFAEELTSSASASVYATKVIPLQKVEGISPTDLQAGITALALQKHIEKDQQHSFHHVKAEKIVHLSEYILNIDLNRNPVKDAAGPNDFPHAKKVESRARKAGFYSVYKNGDYYDYKQRNSFNKVIQKAQNSLGENADTLSQIIGILVPMSTQHAEVVATVYAAWNNLLLTKKMFSDEDIVTEARENWHENKLAIERDKFFSTLKWMRKHELLIPKGNGKVVMPKEPNKK